VSLKLNLEVDCTKVFSCWCFLVECKASLIFYSETKLFRAVPTCANLCWICLISLKPGLVLKLYSFCGCVWSFCASLCPVRVAEFSLHCSLSEDISIKYLEACPRYPSIPGTATPTVPCPSSEEASIRFWVLTVSSILVFLRSVRVEVWRLRSEVWGLKSEVRGLRSAVWSMRCYVYLGLSKSLVICLGLSISWKFVWVCLVHCRFLSVCLGPWSFCLGLSNSLEVCFVLSRSLGVCLGLSMSLDVCLGLSMLLEVCIV